MGKFKDYPKATSMASDDIFLIGGDKGTKYISLDDVRKTLLTLEKYDTKPAVFTDYVHCYKRLGMVNIVYSGDITTLTSQNRTRLFILPDAYKPVSLVRVNVSNSVDRIMTIEFCPDGTVQVFNYGATVDAQTNFSFEATYVAANI